MATLWTEDWAGADESPWPARWAVSGTSPDSPDIQGGAGRLRTGDTQYLYMSRTLATGEAPAVDYDVSVKVGFDNPPKQAFVVLAVRISVGWSYLDPVTGYWFEMAPGAGSYILHRNVDYSETTLGSESYSYVAGTPVWVRLQAVGSEIKAKLWDDGDAEPSGWGIEVTDSEIPGPGLVGMSILPADDAVCTAVWDSLVVGDGAPPPEPSPGRLSAGTRPVGALTPTTAVRGALAATTTTPGRLSTTTGV